MAYIPVQSVIVTQDDPSKLQASITGTVTIRNLPSVSGQVGASILGTVPVTQVTDPWRVTQNGSVATVIIGGSVSASFTPPANQSVSGTVGASIIGHAPVVIVGGSVAVSIAPPANQSVSGTVQSEQIGTRITSVISSNPSSMLVGASIIGLPPVNVTNFPAVQAVAPNNSSVFSLQPAGSVLAVSGSFTPPANQSVSGTVQADIRGSVAVAIISGSVAVATGNSSVQVLNFPTNTSVSGAVSISNFPTNQNVSGSVVAFQGTSPWLTVPTSGSIIANQGGTVITSVVNIVPSSMIVGASIFGQVPVFNIGGVSSVFSAGGISSVTQAGAWTHSVVGSVTAYQGAVPWVMNFQNSSIIAINAGSVVALSQGSVITVLQSPSIVGTYSEDAAHTTADRGLFVLGVRNDAVASFASANLEYSPMGTDSAGRSVTKPFAPEEARVEGYNSVVSGSVTTLVGAGGAGLRNYITDIILANTGATTALVTFRSGGGTSVLGYGIAPAGGGSNMLGFATPMRTLANETFDFQVVPSSSVIYAKVSGYKGP